MRLPPGNQWAGGRGRPGKGKGMRPAGAAGSAQPTAPGRGPGARPLPSWLAGSRRGWDPRAGRGAVPSTRRRDPSPPPPPPPPGPAGPAPSRRGGASAPALSATRRGPAGARVSFLLLLLLSAWGTRRGSPASWRRREGGRDAPVPRRERRSAPPGPALFPLGAAVAAPAAPPPRARGAPRSLRRPPPRVAMGTEPPLGAAAAVLPLGRDGTRARTGQHGAGRRRRHGTGGEPRSCGARRCAG